MTATKDLLAAYAAGGLTEDERRRVEALLADDEQARAELDELRALIDETRDARPAPEREPAWDDMARAIRLAVDETQPAWWTRWWVRPVALSAAAAAVAVALYVGLASKDEPAVATVAPEPAPAPAPDIELPGLDEAWEADSIVYELDPSEEFEGMFATANDDETDTEPVLDFRLPPEPYELIDDFDEDELEAVETYLEGKPS